VVGSFGIALSWRYLSVLGQNFCFVSVSILNEAETKETNVMKASLHILK
jgi:hypothetical protein